MLLALSESWTDFYAITGFWLAILGLLVGVLGFAYTIYQVRKTQSAVAAAREASLRVLEESRASFERFVAAFAHRLMNDARAAVDTESWQLASTRASDLADLVAQLQLSGNPPVIAVVHRLREFARVFAAKAKNPGKRHAPTKWERLLQELSPVLDRLQTPFTAPTEAPR
jgi:hypothetical protein